MRRCSGLRLAAAKTFRRLHRRVPRSLESELSRARTMQSVPNGPLLKRGGPGQHANPGSAPPVAKTLALPRSGLSQRFHVYQTAQKPDSRTATIDRAAIDRRLLPSPATISDDRTSCRRRTRSGSKRRSEPRDETAIRALPGLRQEDEIRMHGPTRGNFRHCAAVLMRMRTDAHPRCRSRDFTEPVIHVPPATCRTRGRE
jgi:hypothetical protein